MLNSIKIPHVFHKLHRPERTAGASHLHPGDRVRLDGRGVPHLGARLVQPMVVASNDHGSTLRAEAEGEYTLLQKTGAGWDGCGNERRA